MRGSAPCTVVQKVLTVGGDCIEHRLPRRMASVDRLPTDACCRGACLAAAETAIDVQP
jgi:hypothetical protein